MSKNLKIILLILYFVLSKKLSLHWNSIYTPTLSYRSECFDPLFLTNHWADIFKFIFEITNYWYYKYQLVIKTVLKSLTPSKFSYQFFSNIKKVLWMFKCLKTISWTIFQKN